MARKYGRKFKRRRRHKKSLKQFIKDTVEGQAEQHIFDSTASTGIGTTAVVTNLSPIAQGDLVSQRQGSKVDLSGIVFNYNLQSADAFNLVRVIVFQWYMDNASETPDISDLLQNTGSIQDVMVSPYLRKSGVQKYRILLDKTHALNTDYSGGVTVTKPSKNFIKKGFRKSLSFANTATTGTGAIYVCTISDSAAVSHPVINYNARVLYTDL